MQRHTTAGHDFGWVRVQGIRISGYEPPSYMHQYVDRVQLAAGVGDKKLEKQTQGYGGHEDSGTREREVYVHVLLTSRCVLLANPVTSEHPRTRCSNGHLGVLRTSSNTHFQSGTMKCLQAQSHMNRGEIDPRCTVFGNGCR